MSPKKWSKNTFGWARAEVLGALVNAVFLVALCFSITIESIKRFVDLEMIHNPENVLIVGFIGLMVNVVGLFLLYDSGGHGHSHGHSKLSQLSSIDDNENEDYIFGEPHKVKPPSPVVPKKSSGHGHSHSPGQMNMRAAFLHVMSDALGSVIVMISAVIIKVSFTINFILNLTFFYLLNSTRIGNTNCTAIPPCRCYSSFSFSIPFGHCCANQRSFSSKLFQRTSRWTPFSDDFWSEWTEF